MCSKSCLEFHSAAQKPMLSRGIPLPEKLPKVRFEKRAIFFGEEKFNPTQVFYMVKGSS